MIMARHFYDSLARPIIGVFISRGQLTKLLSNNQTFRQYYRIRELVSANEEVQATLYFFSVKNLDDKNKSINGVYYNNEKKQWEQKLFPYPDVFYDRGGGTSKYKRENRKIRAEMKNNKRTLFLNSRHYFDKWQVYKKLVKMKACHRYLPKTEIYNTNEQLLRFIDTYESVYLKGLTSSRGKEILRVDKLDSGTYKCGYLKGYLVNKAFFNKEQLLDEVHQFFQTEQFLLQQAVDLISFQRHLIDMRAEVQRNGQGELDIVAISVRIGSADSPITTHAKSYSFEVFFTHLLNHPPNEVIKLRKQIEQFLRTIYSSMEKCYGYFGELGIDFGIDKQGKIWFIETNAKSAKVSLYNAYDKNTVRRAFVNPLMFANYLYKNRKRIKRLKKIK